MVERRTEENQGLTKEEAMRDVMKRRMFGMGIDRTRFWISGSMLGRHSGRCIWRIRVDVIGP